MDYFLVLTEIENPTKQKALEMWQMLNELKPVPFEENVIIFKFYLSNPQYTNYTLQATDYNPREFINLNIDLMKTQDNQQNRAHLHKVYAIKMTKYLLEQLFLSS
jgi:hypothetical protein